MPAPEPHEVPGEDQHEKSGQRKRRDGPQALPDLICSAPEGYPSPAHNRVEKAVLSAFGQTGVFFGFFRVRFTGVSKRPVESPVGYAQQFAVASAVSVGVYGCSAQIGTLRPQSPGFLRAVLPRLAQLVVLAVCSQVQKRNARVKESPLKVELLEHRCRDESNFRHDEPPDGRRIAHVLFLLNGSDNPLGHPLRLGHKRGWIVHSNVIFVSVSPAFADP